MTSANSPYAVQTPAAEAGPEKAGALVSRITQFLLGQPKPASYRHLIVRKPRQPTIIAPREGKVLPAPVIFEWAGPERLRYGVRVLGSQGRVWEQANLPRRPLSYPETAPILRGGAQYTWELEAKGHPTQRATFHILTAAEADRVQEALALLQAGVGPGYPPNTAVLLRAGLLYQEGLYHEARRELLDGIAAAPGEPTLHVLLGHVYERVGLKELAAETFEEAKVRRTREP